MNRKIIIVTGYVASGKTTFSLQLSKKLFIPCFNKDLLKVALGDYIHDNSAEDGRRLSRASFDLMTHIMKKLMEVGKPFIIEGPFINCDAVSKVNEGNIIKSIIEQYGYCSLTYVFVGDLDVLHNRFIERENSPNREHIIQVHGLFDDIRFFKKINGPLSRFNIGGNVIKVDTTNFELVDFDKYIAIATDFLELDA